MARYDVIVIGVGSMGSATCYELARREAKVLGLEQFGIPHALGAHHGHSRMIRLAYYEHPDYVPLLRRSYERWAELEAASGQKLLHITGGIYMGPPMGPFVSGSTRAAEEHKLPHEVLDRGELARRFPMFNVPEHYVGLHEPSAGLLLPERVVAAYAELAMRHGAELHGDEPVESWSAGSGGVTVTTRRGTYHADHLVFTAGAWTSKLLRDLGVELTVTRQVLGWVWPRKPELFALGRFPVWAIEHDDTTAHYGFPMLPENPGLKIAHHWKDRQVDPATVNRAAEPGDEEDFMPALRRFIPDGVGPILATRVCLYTNSPDKHFIIDRHPRHERVTVACGFSGHGFKFVSAMGEALADLATRGRTQLPVGFLALDGERRMR